MVFRAEPSAPVVLDGDAAAAAIAASERLYESSGLAFLADPDGLAGPAGLADDAAAVRAPILLAGAGLDAELERLGVEVVVHAAGDAPAELPAGIRAVAIDPASPTALADAELPPVEVAAEPAAAVLYLADDADEAASAVVGALVEAAGGAVVEAPGGDPRASAESVAAAHAHAGGHVLAVGESFGDAERLAERHRVAATGVQLPGGGQLPLHGKLLVAAYGHPGEPVLGVLGEHDLEGAIVDVQRRAAEYQELTGLTVVPTFEIITTIASAGPGDDGDYSSETDIETLRPWIERAGEEGIYVVLDLQPGHTSFLDQAKRYAELLEHPHVGLALDPEWRLKPGQRHMVQIGSVHVDEVNATIDWLAELTAEHALPQKVVVVHQFSWHMIEERHRLDTSRDEIAVLIHVDGHGTPPLKMETWGALLDELPEGAALGWKNFIDEDTPTFTPAETLAIEPLPVFVSYQ